MIDKVGFKEWLRVTSSHSDRVINDIICRMNRADSISEWTNTDTYLFYLEKNPVFLDLTISVRSQLRKSIRLYSEYIHSLENAN